MDPSMSADTDSQGTSPATLRKPPQKPGRHRFKPQLSCTFCRNRKLKCDRNQPCENCSKRNQGSSCTYMNPPKDKSYQGSKPTGVSKDMQKQIRHLEGLVVTLMNKAATKPSLENGPDSSSSSSTPPEALAPHLDSTGPDIRPSRSTAFPMADPTESLGRITIEDDQNTYVGSSHWTAILDSVGSNLSWEISNVVYNRLTGIDCLFERSNRERRSC